MQIWTEMTSQIQVSLPPFCGKRTQLLPKRVPATRMHLKTFTHKESEATTPLRHPHPRPTAAGTRSLQQLSLLKHFLTSWLPLTASQTSAHPANLSLHLEWDSNCSLTALSAFPSSFPNSFYADISPNNIFALLVPSWHLLLRGRDNMSFIHTFIHSRNIHWVPTMFLTLVSCPGERGTGLRSPTFPALPLAVMNCFPLFGFYHVLDMELRAHHRP